MVSGQNKNQVWLTTLATIEKVGARFEQSWKNNTCFKTVWTVLLTQSQLVEEDDPEAAVVAEQIVIITHNATQASGAATPRKRTRVEVMLELHCQNDKALKKIQYTIAHNRPGSAAFLELQEKVQFLGQQLKAVPVLQTVRDIRQLDSNVAALTNIVGFDGPEVAPRSVMDHVDTLLTHAGTVDSKVAAVDTRVNEVEVLAQGGVACNVTIKDWIASFGPYFNVLVQTCLNLVSSQLTLRLLPIETFFASIGTSGVFKASSLSLQPPVVGENLLSQIEDFEHALGVGEFSTFPIE